MVKSTSSKVTHMDSRARADQLHVGDIIVEGFAREEYVVLEIASTSERGVWKLTVSEHGNKTAIYTVTVTPQNRFEVKR